MRLAGMNAALLPLASSDMDPVHDIVGLRARSARCATASQLTRDQHISLRLPQTTSAHRPDPTNQPALKPTPLASTVDWGSHTVPQRGLNDAVLASPRGSLLDGPSSINTMALLQTHPPGHNDRVSQRTGRWDDVALLAYDQRIESEARTKSRPEDTDGPMPPKSMSDMHPTAEVSLESREELVYSLANDCGGPKPDSAARYLLGAIYGVLAPMAEPCLRPALDHTKLKATTGPDMAVDYALRDDRLPSLGTSRHRAGTCAMSSGPASVVELDPRVRGGEGLGVADASAMSSAPGMNFNATVLGITEVPRTPSTNVQPQPREDALANQHPKTSNIAPCNTFRPCVPAPHQPSQAGPYSPYPSVHSLTGPVLHTLDCAEHRPSGSVARDASAAARRLAVTDPRAMVKSSVPRRNRREVTDVPIDTDTGAIHSLGPGRPAYQLPRCFLSVLARSRRALPPAMYHHHAHQG
jgi:hypothetical protein